MLNTQIANRNYKTCIYNASGVHCITKEDLQDLYKSSSSIVLSKSCTLEYRSGNVLPRYFDNDNLSINSSGLPNMGYDFYNHLGENFESKDYFLSLAGMKPSDNLFMLEHLSNTINGIELNLSCPNIAGKAQIGYDFESTEEILRKASELLDTNLTFGIKLPPYFDETHFNTMADIINSSKVNSITCINSIGNGLVVDPNTNKVVIKPKRGYGGIGGSIVKPTALANVHKFYKLTKCSIIGCGGISNGTDAYEHILCGASAFQIGTQLYKEGISCFDRIQEELETVMTSKGYSNLNDFRGKLEYL